MTDQEIAKITMHDNRLCLEVSLFKMEIPTTLKMLFYLSSQVRPYKRELRQHHKALKERLRDSYAYSPLTEQSNREANAVYAKTGLLRALVDIVETLLISWYSR